MTRKLKELDSLWKKALSRLLRNRRYHTAPPEQKEQMLQKMIRSIEEEIRSVEARKDNRA